MNEDKDTGSIKALAIVLDLLGAMTFTSHVIRNTCSLILRAETCTYYCSIQSQASFVFGWCPHVINDDGTLCISCTSVVHDISLLCVLSLSSSYNDLAL